MHRWPPFHNAKLRTASAVQAHLAMGADGQSIQVAVNRATTQAVDQAFSIIVTCGEEPVAVFAVSGGFFNTINVPQVTRCALTGSWYNSAPGSVPQDQGYVSTWATSVATGTIQTKNGGYGVQSGFGADLVATC